MTTLSPERPPSCPAAAYESARDAQPSTRLGVPEPASTAAPTEARTRALVNFIFDGGRLNDDHDIRLCPDELDTFGSTIRSDAAASRPHAWRHASMPR